MSQTKNRYWDLTLLDRFILLKLWKMQKLLKTYYLLFLVKTYPLKDILNPNMKSVTSPLKRQGAP